MTIAQDISLASRHLLKSPGFTIAAIVTLALGIGANTAMFTVIDSVLLRPLPYPHANRLMRIGEGSKQPGSDQTSLPNWQDLRSGAKSFEDIGGYIVDVAILQGSQRAEMMIAPKLTCNMLQVLRVGPKLGRGLNDSDCAEGAPPVVLLSDPAWRRNFGADPNIVGRQVRIGDVPHTVIGVMPSGFAFPDEERADAVKGIWLASRVTQEMKKRGFTLYALLGRLRQGSTERQAQAELSTVAADIRKQDPEDSKDLQFSVKPYRDAITGSVRPAFLALSSALVLVLLIACANVANLQLSRCLARHQELAVRAALGAPKWRLLRELLAEGAVLSMLGALAGLALATGILQAFRALPEGLVPRAEEIHMRFTVIAALAALAALATILSSFIPGLVAMNTEPQIVLRGAGRGVSRQAVRSRLAGWLVVGEVAVATALLVACSLLFRTLYNLEHKPLGFETDNVITFMAMPPNSPGYLSGAPPSKTAPAVSTHVYQPILDRLRSLPGVRYAALASSVPFDGVDMRSSFEINGHKETGQEERNRHAELRVMSGDYMRAVGTPILQGRAISDNDTDERPYVAVVNRTFARDFLRGMNPIGQRISLGGKETQMVQPYTIVGVAADAVQKRVSAPVMPELMLSYRQIPETSFFYPLLVSSATNYIIRTERGGDLSGSLRSVFHEIAPEFAIDNMQTLQKAADRSNFNQRLGFYLIGSFAAVAVVMVLIGLYGVLSQVVGQRRQEIGIRIAVGATSDEILRMILREGSLLIGAGLVIGVLGAAAMSRLIAGFLFGVRAFDAWSYTAAACALLAVGLLAASIPARRASLIEPMEALRVE